MYEYRGYVRYYKQIIRQLKDNILKSSQQTCVYIISHAIAPSLKQVYVYEAETLEICNEQQIFQNNNTNKVWHETTSDEAPDYGQVDEYMAGFQNVLRFQSFPFSSLSMDRKKYTYRQLKNIQHLTL